MLVSQGTVLQIKSIPVNDFSTIKKLHILMWQNLFHCNKIYCKNHVLKYVKVMHGNVTAISYVNHTGVQNSEDHNSLIKNI